MRVSDPRNARQPGPSPAWAAVPQCPPRFLLFQDSHFRPGLASIHESSLWIVPGLSIKKHADPLPETVKPCRQGEVLSNSRITVPQHKEWAAISVIQMINGRRPRSNSQAVYCTRSREKVGESRRLQGAWAALAAYLTLRALLSLHKGMSLSAGILWLSSWHRHQDSQQRYDQFLCQDFVAKLCS